MESALLLIIILLTSALFLLKNLKNQERKQGKSNQPPGPRKLPVIGNLHQLRNPLHRTLSCLSKQHGPLMSLQLGFRPALVISSAEMAEQFLKTHDLDCSNHPHITFFQKLSYDGNDIVFSPYGEQWRELRKIVSQELLSIKKVSSFQTLREQEIEMFISSISDSAAASIPVNLTEITISLANKVVTKMAFGESYNYHKEGRLHEIISGFASVTSSFCFADYLPQFGWVDGVRGLQAKVDAYFTELDGIFEQLIGEHLDLKGKIGEPKAECILDLMLDMLNDPTKNITMNNIKGIVMNIFLAGTDSTSTVIEWAMTELIRNPDIMKKVQDEVRGVVGGKGRVQKTDIQHLEYFKMILKETLRLHPPSPLLQREVISGFKVDEYDIHPKTLLIFNAWAIGREEAYWERPEEFFPERFMNSPVDTNDRNFHLIPFGAGRRLCPGMNMGMAMVEIALANLLFAFNWEPILHGMTKEDIDLDESLGIVMRKKNPLIVMATKYTMMQE